MIVGMKTSACIIPIGKSENIAHQLESFARRPNAKTKCF